jgi:hypothetical protein
MDRHHDMDQKIKNTVDGYFFIIQIPIEMIKIRFIIYLEYEKVKSMFLLSRCDTSDPPGHFYF